MFIKNKVFLSLCFVCLLCNLPDGQTCTYPSDFTAGSIWKHSVHGTVTFSSTSVLQMSVEPYGNIDGTCTTELTAGSKYISVSSGIVTVLGTVYISICLKFEKISDYLYKITHQSSELSGANYARIVVLAAPNQAIEAAVCTDTANTEYFLLMKDGQIDNAKIDCPISMQGTLSYSINGTLCPSNIGSANACTDKKKLTFNYNSCSTNVAYSAGGNLNCLYSSTSGTTTLLWLYNLDPSAPDESSTYLFTCVKFSVTGTTLQATQNPQQCDSTQTTTAISTGDTAEAGGATITGTIAACDASTNLITWTLLAAVTMSSILHQYYLY